MDNARTSSGFGPNGITWSDMQAYFNLRDIKPSDMELRIIRRLDAVAMKHYQEEIKKSSKTKTK